MPGFITQEQADKIKEIIDSDANLVSQYFKVKGLPNYDKFNDVAYKQAFPKGIPNTAEGVAVYNEWLQKTDNAYYELVNQKLLGSYVVGACVIGGLAIAMAKANQDIDLFNLWEDNNDGYEDLSGEVQHALETYFGLPMEALDALQHINDEHNRDNLIAKKLATKRTTQEQITDMRRTALKAQVDKFATGENSDDYAFTVVFLNDTTEPEV